MLYQLDTLVGFWIVLLDGIVLALVIYLFRQQRGASTKWAAILGVILLTLPLSGIKLLLSSPGTMASTPGLVTIKNPERRIAKLYYLRNHPKGTWQVDWVEYVLFTGKESVLEMEGGYGMVVAYNQAGKWYYVPIHVGRSFQHEITFPKDFRAVDTSGRIEAAVNRHLLDESVSWLSILLTVGSAGVLAVLFGRVIRRRGTLKTLPVRA